MPRVSANLDPVAARRVNAILALHLPSPEDSSGIETDSDIASLFESIAQEKRSRLLRDAIFAPILPLVAQPGDRDPKRTIPRWAWHGLWQTLCEFEPTLCQTAVTWQLTGNAEPPLPFIALAECACELCHTGPDRIVGNQTRPSDVEQVRELGRVLALYPLLYRALAYLPDGLKPLRREQVNAFYGLYTQATAQGRDNGPRFLKALFAHLETCAQKIQILERIGGAPSERSLVATTITEAMTSLMDDLQWKLSLIRQMLGRGLPNDPSAVAAAADIAHCVADLDAVDAYGASDDKAPWRQPASRARALIVRLVETALQELSSDIDPLLPFTVESSGLGFRSLDIDLMQPFATEDLERARATLTFIRALDAIAASAGFGLAISRAGAIIDAKLEGYLGLIREKADTVTPAQAEMINPCLKALMSLIEDRGNASQIDYARKIIKQLTLPQFPPRDDDQTDTTSEIFERAARRQLNRLQ